MVRIETTSSDARLTESDIKMNIKNPMIPLLLIIMIDYVGFGIVYPILPSVFMGNEGSIVGIGASQGLKNFWYGITLSVFPLMIFFGAIIFGGISDQLGRKKVLRFCLLGTALSYFLSGFAIDFQSLSLLIISRAVAGLTAGSMPIAQAAIINTSTKENMTSNLGLAVFMGSIGFLLGPLLSGLFTNADILPWFKSSTPLYGSALLSLVNVWLLNSFDEMVIPKQDTVSFFSQCIHYIVSPFKMRAIRRLSVGFLFMQLGWSFYFQYIALYLLKIYEFSPQHISCFMFLMGTGFAIGACWVIHLITKYLRDESSVCLTLITSSFLIAISVLCNSNKLIIWGGAFALGVTMSIAYSLMMKLFSNLVEENKQGWIMGVCEAIVAITWTITPLVSIYLESLSLFVPLLSAALLLFVSALTIKYWKVESRAFSFSAQESTFHGIYKNELISK